MTGSAHAAHSPVALRAARSIEDSTALDGPIGAVRRTVLGVLDARPRVAALLHGRAPGHAAHPLLTDVPLGLWTSGTVLDLVGGPSAHPHADRLLGLGVLAAAPTTVTGLADWAVSDVATRRVGAVHAVANAGALGLYATSWLLRRRGRRGAGVAASLLAGALVGVGGYLGGHMSFRLGAPPRAASGPVEPQDRGQDAEPPTSG